MQLGKGWGPDAVSFVALYCSTRLEIKTSGASPRLSPGRTHGSRTAASVRVGAGDSWVLGGAVGRRRALPQPLLGRESCDGRCLGKLRARARPRSRYFNLLTSKTACWYRTGRGAEAGNHLDRRAFHFLQRSRHSWLLMGSSSESQRLYQTAVNYWPGASRPFLNRKPNVFM